jgi:hypothetical protein
MPDRRSVSRRRTRCAPGNRRRRLPPPVAVASARSGQRREALTAVVAPEMPEPRRTARTAARRRPSKAVRGGVDRTGAGWPVRRLADKRDPVMA